MFNIQTNPKRSTCAWWFASHVDYKNRECWEFGLGGFRCGYLRASLWINRTNHTERCCWGLQHWVDNYGPLWQGFSWSPLRCQALVSFRWYRRIATHLSFGPLHLSYVNDRDGFGPIGPVYTITTSKAAQEVSA